jgi:hypothetical protein
VLPEISADCLGEQHPVSDFIGFLLVYLNSFNEWHEGHAFEPMQDAAELTPDERALGYRNAERGDYRLRTLAELQWQILESVSPPVALQ